MASADSHQVLALDVADSQSITDAAETVKSTVGRLDLLINNASGASTTLDSC